MTFPKRMIALGGAVLLTLGSTGVATAQTEGGGSIDASSLGPIAGSVSSADTAELGEETGGFLNTFGSGTGEPTLGSAPGSAQDAWAGSVAGLDIDPNEETGELVQGSINSTFCGEPTVDNVEECLGVLSGELVTPGSLSGSIEGGTGSDAGSLALGSAAVSSAAVIGAGAALTQGIEFEGFQIPPVEIPTFELPELSLEDTTDCDC